MADDSDPPDLRYHVFDREPWPELKMFQLLKATGSWRWYEDCSTGHRFKVNGRRGWDESAANAWSDMVIYLELQLAEAAEAVSNFHLTPRKNQKNPQPYPVLKFALQRAWSRLEYAWKEHDRVVAVEKAEGS